MVITVIAKFLKRFDFLLHSFTIKKTKENKIITARGTKQLSNVFVKNSDSFTRPKLTSSIKQSNERTVSVPYPTSLAGVIESLNSFGNEMLKLNTAETICK